MLRLTAHGGPIPVDPVKFYQLTASYNSVNLSRVYMTSP